VVAFAFDVAPILDDSSGYNEYGHKAYHYQGTEEAKFATLNLLQGRLEIRGVVTREESRKSQRRQRNVENHTT
jgi:hypothetical protein